MEKLAEFAPRPGSYMVVRVDGAIETIEKKPTIGEIRRKITAESLDTVNLRNGYVMCVDDTGMIDGRPVNPKATALYHSVCRPGTVQQIHGDAVIAWDEDFA